MKISVNVFSNSTGAITEYAVRDWSINVYSVERFILESKLTEEQQKKLSQSGVYLLVNDNCVYVGQAENIFKRWNQHINDEKKDWFDCAYAITDCRGFSATDLNALEYLLHSKAKEAGRFSVMNEKSTDNQMKDYQTDDNFYNTVFEHLNTLLNSIYRGHRVFDKINTEVLSEMNIDENGSSINDELQNKIFTMKQDVCFGQLKKVKEGWLLLKGAQSRETDFENSVKTEASKKIIRYCIAYLDGKMDSNLKTTEDILFTSPSSPAAALLQRPSNGWTVWKDDDGRPLDSYRVQGKK